MIITLRMAGSCSFVCPCSVTPWKLGPSRCDCDGRENPLGEESGISSVEFGSDIFFGLFFYLCIFGLLFLYYYLGLGFVFVVCRQT